MMEDIALSRGGGWRDIRCTRRDSRTILWGEAYWRPHAGDRPKWSSVPEVEYCKFNILIPGIKFNFKIDCNIKIASYTENINARLPFQSLHIWNPHAGLLLAQRICAGPNVFWWIYMTNYMTNYQFGRVWLRNKFQTGLKIKKLSVITKTPPYFVFHLQIWNRHVSLPFLALKH